MFNKSARNTVLLLSFLALTPAFNGAYAQSVTGGDPVPRTTWPGSRSSLTAWSSIVTVFLLALQGA